ncbi:MAG TPA: hypothetical protein ENK18_03525 [Deltaproteobacteria bacterium]|nr:hypothetical protein [Deltaproteobacteria bacterium]
MVHRSAQDLLVAGGEDVMGGFLGALVALLTLGMVAGVELGWFTLELVADTALMVTAGVALIGVTKVPWDLYLQARGVLDEQRRSTEIGLEVPEGDKVITKKMVTWLLVACVVLHLLLAGGASAVAVWRDAPAGWAFAAAYVAATGIRPAWAAHRRLSERLRRMLQRATYPRDDVLELRRRLEEIATLTAQVPQLQHALTELKQGLAERDDQLRARSRSLEQRIEQLTGHFESAVARATEDADTLKGLRALARLLKQA